MSDAPDFLGKCVEIPVHFDAWMRGARFGVVTAFRRGGAGTADYVLVKMDNPQIKNRVCIPRSDWPYIKVLT